MIFIKSAGYGIFASLMIGGIFDGIGAINALLSYGASFSSSLCLINWDNLGCSELLSGYVILFVSFFLLGLVRFSRKGK